MKVIKFRLNGKIFTLNKEDGKYYSEDGNWANYCETLDEGSVVEIESKIMNIQEYVKETFKERKIGALSQIESYLNYKYPNVTVSYKNGNFIIEGDSSESEKCREDIEETLKFSAKKK